MLRSVEAARLFGLANDERGLSANEVDARRARYGPNVIVEVPPAGWRDVLGDTAKDPMLWFLGATAILFASLGDRTEALVMLVAIVPLVGMDAFLHRRTQASTQGLSSRLAAQATVLRDGARARVRAVDLVPGDLAVVGTGESFPADGVLVSGESLQADESALTGEAFPVAKQPMVIEPDAAEDFVVDGKHWGFAGTRLLTGEARIRVVATGGATLYGEIVRSAQSGSHARTPLQKSIASLVAALLAAAAALCVILAWVRLGQGQGLVDALLSAATLAVAAIPEEFPIVFTFFLGVGVFRLARRQALVRRAVAVENVGRVTCICSDKTGTLTEGRLRVAHCIAAPGFDSLAVLASAAMASRRETGDPLDIAILDANQAEHPAGERLATFPFAEDRRRETGVFRDASGTIVAATKGAPETILALCALEAAERASWVARVEELARSGHKVIACAAREAGIGEWHGAEPPGGYRLRGLIACEDPVRPGVADAVADVRQAGIRVIMITGDHVITAGAVARELGIGGAEPRAIEGEQLGKLMANDVRAVDVVARAMPAHKLALVRALQDRGEIVAVTGDGVNDVPALQSADVGIAMGERGTQSAREVAAMVLLDDNFRTIASAIAEGRQLFQNLRLSFGYLLMIHVPLVFTATLIPLAGYPLLYLPIHIVWLELVIHPTALLVFQELPPSGRLARSSPRRRDGRFFTAREWLAVGLVGAAVTLAVTFAYEQSLQADVRAEHARATALVVLVVASAALTAALSGLRTRVARTVCVLTVSSALLLVQIRPLAALLDLAPLDTSEWLIAAGAGALTGALAAPFRWMR